MSCRSVTSTPAVGSSRNRICGSCESALAIMTRRFMPPDSVMIWLSFLSQSDRSFSTFSMKAGFGFLPNSKPAETHRRPHRLERVGVQFLRHQPDQRTRRAIVLDEMMASDQHRTGGRIDDAADDVDQRGLAGAVRPEQREDFPARDVEIDALQRMKSGRIGLDQIGDRNDRLHAGTGKRRGGARDIVCRARQMHGPRSFIELMLPGRSPRVFRALLRGNRQFCEATHPRPRSSAVTRAR